VVFLFALWGCWRIWRGTLTRSGWFLRLAVWVVALPFVINTAGWMLTENGRQPWIVQGLMKTSNGVSPTVSTLWVVISILTFLLLYAVLAVVAWGLMVRYTRRGPEPADPVGEPAPDDRVRAMTY